MDPLPVTQVHRVHPQINTGPLTCEDLPRLFLVVIVLDQVAGETIGSGRKTPHQQKHFFIGTDPVMAEMWVC